MDNKLKAKWVAALRSGKYKQAQDRLRRDGGYCCLGVLCDVSGAGEWIEDGDGVLFFHAEGHDDNGLDSYVDAALDMRLRDLLGINVIVESELIDQNDAGASFSEIADYIEQNDMNPPAMPLDAF